MFHNCIHIGWGLVFLLVKTEGVLVGEEEEHQMLLLLLLGRFARLHIQGRHHVKEKLKTITLETTTEDHSQPQRLMEDHQLLVLSVHNRGCHQSWLGGDNNNVAAKQVETKDPPQEISEWRQYHLRRRRSAST